MFPIRTNFYNKDIFMIHEEKLLSLISKTDDLLLKEYIGDLIEKYRRERYYFKDIPFELRNWPNCYVGFTRSDIRNSQLIDFAILNSMDDSIWTLYDDYLIYACGVAFLQEKYELANDLLKIKRLLTQSTSVSIKNILEVVTEESLNYLLAYIQTKNKVTNDKRIVFYIGEKYVVLDTILSPQNHNKNKKYGLEQSNKML